MRPPEQTATPGHVEEGSTNGSEQDPDDRWRKGNFHGARLDVTGVDGGGSGGKEEQRECRRNSLLKTGV